MSVVAWWRRAVALLRDPDPIWIDLVPAAATGLAGYSVALAALLPDGLFVATALIGERRIVDGHPATVRAGLAGAAISMVLTHARLALAPVVLALFIDLLAPGFRARHQPLAALKIGVLALTPLWLAGALALTSTLHPSLFALFGLALVAGTLWSWHLAARGIVILLGAPERRAPVHAAIAVAATAIVIGTALSVVATLVGSAAWLGRPS
jgi:hypothetical protein